MRKRDERGYVLVIVALSALALLTMAGFAVDLGSWYLNASRLQRASDTAALAGAVRLPDDNTAIATVDQSFAHNGFVNGAHGISITRTASAGQVITSVKSNSIATYFTSWFLPHLTISRSSTAESIDTAPALGSPYNVLGTGNLSIPGVPVQNFWLAINGDCSAKEDGDYFSAIYDSNKGPFTTAQDAHGNYVPKSNAMHHCDSTQATNGTYNAAGYSYYVNVPPHNGGTVAIRVYDAPYYGNDYPSGGPDQSIDLPGEGNGGFDTEFNIWNTNGSPGDESKQTLVKSWGFHNHDVDTSVRDAWYTLYTVPAQMVATGGQFRVQVAISDGTAGRSIQWDHGVNSFGLGAFASWIGGGNGGCDTRTTSDCPGVSGRNAESVYNNISTATNDATYYFAAVPATYIGRTFKIYLWDPGEGVKGMQLLAPDGTPLYFDYDSPPTENSTTGYSGTNVNTLDTSGTGPPANPSLSNNFKFNDRLVTLSVTLPSNYYSMLADNGNDDWLRIRYVLDASPNDRTTWGISIGDNGSAPPKLVNQ